MDNAAAAQEATGTREVDGGLISLFVDDTEVDKSCATEAAAPSTIQPIVITITHDDTSRDAPAQSTAAALALPMSHRHRLPAGTIQMAPQAATGALSSSPIDNPSVIRERDDSDILRDAVPEPHMYSRSPTVSGLGTSIAQPTISLPPPHSGSAMVPMEGSGLVTAAFAFPTTTVQRSDVDDAIIMQQLLERHRRMRLSQQQDSSIKHQGDGRSDEDDDVPHLYSPRITSVPPHPSTSEAPHTTHRQRRLTFLQDEVFLETLDLVSLHDSVDWAGSKTFQVRWWTRTFSCRRVEKDFLRYEVHHHTMVPQLIFGCVVLVTLTAINLVMWTHDADSTLSVLWGVLLGASIGVIGLMIAGWRATALKVTAAYHDNCETRQQTRFNTLWVARLAEVSAWLLQVVLIWATMSAYTMTVSTCYDTRFYYVPWVRGCEVGNNATANVTRCPELEMYCERALFPFAVPAILFSVIVFRPRSVLALPTIASAPFAFAAGRYITSDTKHVDSITVFWTKMSMICVWCLIGAALKISLEREQRRRFKAYASLFHQLSLYVRHREALAHFLDAKLPPLMRTRLISGNVTVDFSHQATCILFDLSDYPSWCAKMMPLSAATSVMQLHDVITARSASAGVSKIRSLGDLFIGASNLAIASPHHAALCCQLALQIFSDAFEFRDAFAAPLALRCGMHSGKALGVVLGATYRRYDVFGDAVATATRVLDVSLGNQIVMTKATADLAQDFAVTAERTATGSPVVTEVESPFTKVVHQLRVLHHLVRLVPSSAAQTTNEEYKKNMQDAKKHWAASVSRDLEDHDELVDEPSRDEPQSNPQHAEYEQPADHQPSTLLERATFDVLRGNTKEECLVTHEATHNPEMLRDPRDLRDYIVSHSNSMSMLTLAVNETRLKRHWGIFKRFAVELHELEFSLTYIRIADRIPYVTTLVALAGLYCSMVAIIVAEDNAFPATIYWKSSNITSNGDRLTPATATGASLLGIAAAVVTAMAIVVFKTPNPISESSLAMWLLACANYSLAFFGAATSSPGVIGSDTTYLFFFAIMTLHFGSWSISGLVLLTIVILGVFLASINTISGTYVPTWILPLIAVVCSLNVYFDRNRERRLREMYRDLFLAKAAAKAVEGEGHVRRSVLRATLPRPLIPLAADASNVGRLLTTSINEAVVVEIRMDTINDCVFAALSSLCEMSMNNSDALPGMTGMSGSVQHPNTSNTASITAALGDLERASGIVEALLDALPGTELALVHACGDTITIAGPLEEHDSRLGAHEAQDVLPTTANDEGGEHVARKREMEQRVQRAAYDAMLLLSQLFQRKSQYRRPSATNPLPLPLSLFSAVCVCDTIINVLANGEFPSYDLLGAGSYFARTLMQQLPPGASVGSERFVQYYQEELRAAAAERGIHIPSTIMGFGGRPEECSTAKFYAPSAERSTDDVESSSEAPLQPRIGEVERWRVRGLGTMWLYPIHPGSLLATTV